MCKEQRWTPTIFETWLRLWLVHVLQKSQHWFFIEKKHNLRKCALPLGVNSHPIGKVFATHLFGYYSYFKKHCTRPNSTVRSWCYTVYTVLMLVDTQTSTENEYDSSSCEDVGCSKFLSSLFSGEKSWEGSWSWTLQHTQDLRVNCTDTSSLKPLTLNLKREEAKTTRDSLSLTTKCPTKYKTY